MRFLISILTALTLAILSTAAMSTLAMAGDRAIIVLDASGSMWGQIDGKAKIEIARETLSKVLASVPDELELGLIAYGHREKGSCGDIEEIVAAGPGTRAAIEAAANSMQPKGKTPISASLRMAAESLRSVEEKASVIIVTDGIETCNADPCAVARELEQSGIGFTAHVVGFGLQDGEGAQVSCIAEITGGKYFEAKDAAALGEALAVTLAAVAEEPPVSVVEEKPQETQVAQATGDNVVLTAMLAKGVPLTGDPFWEIFPDNGAETYTYGPTYSGNFEPGGYRIKLSQGLAKTEIRLNVEAGKPIAQDVVLEAGVVEYSVFPDNDGDAIGDAAATVRASDREHTGYGPGSIVIPAGDFTVTGESGAAKAVVSGKLKAGETVPVKVVLNSGFLRVSSIYSDGNLEVNRSDIFYEVVEAKKSLEGNRKSVAYNYGKEASFMLPAGSYVVIASISKAKGEAPFTVEAGQPVTAVVNLNAGVLEVKAPGASKMELLTTKKDLSGNREVLETVYTPEMNITVGPGTYVVVATFGEAPAADPKAEAKPGETAAAETAPVVLPTSEAEVVVKAAERSELELVPPQQ